MRLLQSAFGALALSSSLLSASHLTAKPCETATLAGSRCEITIEQLHPTQLAYGAIEVSERADKFSQMSDKKLKSYLEKHTVPLVIGPDGIFYITDHHHMSLALSQIFGDELELSAEILENWSELAPGAFREKMLSASYVYLYDERGEGPQTFSDLPSSLHDLKDDPYRSLAWGTRKAGGYAETEVPHADFLWAQFFRSRIDVQLIEKDFKKAIKKAVKVAQSSAAKDLPGYQGADFL